MSNVQTFGLELTKEAKEMVALRLDPSDRRRLKAVAGRLRVSESDLMRYAIKAALEDFAPLADQGKEGAELLSAFLRHSGEKSRLLGLDVGKLDEVLHGDLEDERLRVTSEDIGLLVRGRGAKEFHEWERALVEGTKRPEIFMLTPSAFLTQKYVERLRYEKMAEEQAEEERLHK